MKIAIFLSGHVRTMFHKFDENIKLIRDKVGECEIHLFYSFWNDESRVDRINDAWHLKVNNYVLRKKDIKTKKLNEYFLKIGIDKVDGEIEDISLMKDVIDNTPFRPEYSGRNVLSSQYYKTTRVVSKYFSPDYDFYIRLRSDILLNDFPVKEQILSIVDEKCLLVNEYYWYNKTYEGLDCNEMILGGGKKVFYQVSDIYSNQDKISKQLNYHYGELVTGVHIKNLLNSSILDEVCIFDFKYNVLR